MFDLTRFNNLALEKKKSNDDTCHFWQIDRRHHHHHQCVALKPWNKIHQNFNGIDHYKLRIQAAVFLRLLWLTSLFLANLLNAISMTIWVGFTSTPASNPKSQIVHQTSDGGAPWFHYSWTPRILRQFSPPSDHFLGVGLSIKIFSLSCSTLLW